MLGDARTSCAAGIAAALPGDLRAWSPRWRPRRRERGTRPWDRVHFSPWGFFTTKSVLISQNPLVVVEKRVYHRPPATTAHTQQSRASHPRCEAEMEGCGGWWRRPRHTPGAPAPRSPLPDPGGREAPLGLTGLLGACPVLTLDEPGGEWGAGGTRMTQPAQCVSVKTQRYTVPPCDPNRLPRMSPKQLRAEGPIGLCSPTCTAAKSWEQPRVHRQKETQTWPLHTGASLGTKRKDVLTPVPGEGPGTLSPGDRREDRSLPEGPAT